MANTITYTSILSHSDQRSQSHALKTKNPPAGFGTHGRVFVSYTVTPESLVFVRRFLRVVASNLKPDTKFTKNAKRTKNAEGVGTTVASTHEEGRPYFVFFSMRVSASSRFDLPFFVPFVPFVLGRLVAATLR